jgi:predicted ferric reductase
MISAPWQWYLLRGTGTVLVALLTLAAALGVMSTARAGGALWPRFVTQALHRRVSLLAMAMLTAHVTMAVICEDAEVAWYETFLPRLRSWTGSWEQKGVWISLGILTSNLLLVIVITSLFRHRMSQRSWRTLHVTSYACWAAGVLHGIGIGTDTTTFWEMGVTVASVSVIATVAMIRLATLNHERKLAA